MGQLFALAGSIALAGAQIAVKSGDLAATPVLSIRARPIGHTAAQVAAMGHLRLAL
jgi:hypothetical protein